MQKIKLDIGKISFRKNVVKFAFFTICIIYTNITRASKVLSSSFGYNATNATVAYQNSIQDPADTTIIDFIGNGEYNVDPVIFFNLNNKTIIFEPGVQLLARTGYTVSDCLMQFKQCNGVKILGNNTLLKMRKLEYPVTDTSYRHTLAIVECVNVQVSNLRIEDSGADGIFIGSFSVIPGREYSENIILRNIICNNGRRQGISIISAKNLLVEHCWFKNTIGELPEAGVDLEPDRAADVLQNIEFRKCSFTGNNGSGISISVQNLEASSVPMSIVFNDCYLQHNYASDVPNGTNAESEIYATADSSNYPTGTVVFNRCFVEESNWGALRSRKPANGFTMTFNDCIFKDVASTTALSTGGIPIYPPIWLETTSYYPPLSAAFGGVSFNNLFVDFDANKPFLIANGSTTNVGLANVTGNITVINSISNIAPLFNNVASQTNVTFTHNFINSYPTSSASIINLTNTFNETTCNKNFFTVGRNTANNNYPIAIKHFLTGTAGNGADHFYMPPFNIIPSAVNNVQDTIEAFDDFIAEPNELVVNEIEQSTHYSIGASNTYTASLTNGACTGVLALHFVKIEAYKLQEKHYIKFKVADESVQALYEIQFSTDGTEFKLLTTINSNMQGTYTYNYTPTTSTHKIYYRIKLKENFTTLYSEITSISVNDRALQLYPNPTNDYIFIKDYKTVAKINVLNTQAQIVMEINILSNKINIASLPIGIYYLKIYGKDKNVVTKRIVKM